MNLPLEITFRHMEGSLALEARIRKLAARLERFSSHIMRCHVIVEAPHQHHQQGNLFDVNIDITAPGAHFSIQRASPRDHSHEDPYVALRDAFRAARRKLQDYEREHRRAVKQHAGLPQGRISELDADRGFGRIETEDGRLIYFHRNSVLGKRFEELTTGTKVSFAEESGTRGPQASSVHVR
jgi:cold shock CspA family protein/ribosome-associated translation inhibitor RaiA